MKLGGVRRFYERAILAPRAASNRDYRAASARRRDCGFPRVRVKIALLRIACEGTERERNARLGYDSHGGAQTSIRRTESFAAKAIEIDASHCTFLRFLPAFDSLRVQSVIEITEIRATR